MTEKQAGEALLQFWKAQWEALHPSIKWTPDDEVFTTEAEWLRITMGEPTRENQSIGGARMSNRGTIAVQIFVQPDLGAARSRELADDVRTCLENASIPSPVSGDEPLCLYAGSSRAPATKNTLWSERIVTFKYRFDELRPPTLV